MTREARLAASAQAIEGRIEHLRQLPDGVVHRTPNAVDGLLVRKKGSRLMLVLHAEKRLEVQSRFDMDHPLDLLSAYTQGMMLSLLWVPEPRRVYVLGFGAGRVPMLLHHYFPDLTIECTEINGAVLDVAMRYFGIATDARLRVTIQDGRQYLAERGPEDRFEIIMVDAFLGVGYGPYALATREFYALCRQHLTADGVLAVNILKRDFLYFRKIATVAACFPTVHAVDSPDMGTTVLLASGASDLGTEELLNRARLLAQMHRFAFPFVECAGRLRSVVNEREAAGAGDAAPVLTDANPPPETATESEGPRTALPGRGRTKPTFARRIRGLVQRWLKA